LQPTFATDKVRGVFRRKEIAVATHLDLAPSVRSGVLKLTGLKRGATKCGCCTTRTASHIAASGLGQSGPLESQIDESNRALDKRDLGTKAFSF